MQPSLPSHTLSSFLTKMRIAIITGMTMLTQGAVHTQNYPSQDNSQTTLTKVPSFHFAELSLLFPGKIRQNQADLTKCIGALLKINGWKKNHLLFRESLWQLFQLCFGSKERSRANILLQAAKAVLLCFALRDVLFSRLPEISGRFLVKSS